MKLDLDLQLNQPWQMSGDTARKHAWLVAALAKYNAEAEWFAAQSEYALPESMRSAINELRGDLHGGACYLLQETGYFIEMMRRDQLAWIYQASLWDNAAILKPACRFNGLRELSRSVARLTRQWETEVKAAELAREAGQ